MEVVKDALVSEIGKECAADRRILVPSNEDVQIYLYDIKNVYYSSVDNIG
jgi:hypothetical protein